MLSRALNPVSSSLAEAVTAARQSESARPAKATIGMLSQAMKEGEEWAFREFHRRYFDRLYRLALVLTRGDESVARDVVQDAACRVVRYVRRFEEEEAIWCWLTALVRSSVRDAGRKQRRYWRLLADYAARWLPILVPGAPDPDRLLEQTLMACLSDLEATDRALVEGKYLARLSVRALAERHGLTEKAVEGRLTRARRQLREQAMNRLKENRGDDHA